MLAAGGNAIDAIVAAASTITLTEPCSNGLGSDAFAIVWDGQKLHGLNASGTAPAAWDVEYFKRRHGGVYPLRGWDTVTVPGCVAGWAALHEKFGRLPLEQCLQPAIEYAERGFAVSTIVKRKWDAHVEILKDQPGFAEHFLPRGRAPEYGERFVLQGAAGTLRRIAATQGRAFSEGETAAKLVAHAKANAPEGAGVQAPTEDEVRDALASFRGDVGRPAPGGGDPTPAPVGAGDEATR
jgi:gamma-glutamyltranspeptidase/glutathione hydrolase